MTNVLLVTVPALLGALGTVISAYIGVKVRRVEQQTNGKVTALENELRLVRALLDEVTPPARSRS